MGAASTLRRGVLCLQGFLRLEEIQGSHPVLTAFNINQQVGYFAREVLLDKPPEGFGGHGLPVFQQLHVGDEFLFLYFCAVFGHCYFGFHHPHGGQYPAQIRAHPFWEERLAEKAALE